MNSEKIKYKNNWYYVDSEDLEEPTIEKLFIYRDSDLTKPVKTGSGKTVMVKKSDLKDQLKEYAGAGFSYGGGSSIFPVNRGGQMNRGGFGGASNLGGPNMMYTYEIKPLTRILQPKPSTFNTQEKIHGGHFIEGQELNKKDRKLHRGTVLRVEKNSDGEPMYYVILCDKMGIRIKIDPTTAVLLSGENYVDTRNKMHHMTKDKPDLKRAGQMQESNNPTLRARLVNESNVDEDLKQQLRDAEKRYQMFKNRAYDEYLDPVDFPENVKKELQKLSALKARLKREIDPKKAFQKEKKSKERRIKFRKSNRAKLKDIKKEVIENYPEIEIAEKIYNLRRPDKYMSRDNIQKARNEAELLMDESIFDNISEVSEYVLDARKYAKELKREYGATGKINF